MWAVERDYNQRPLPYSLHIIKHASSYSNKISVAFALACFRLALTYVSPASFLFLSWRDNITLSVRQINMSLLSTRNLTNICFTQALHAVTLGSREIMCYDCLQDSSLWTIKLYFVSKPFNPSPIHNPIIEHCIRNTLGLKVQSSFFFPSLMTCAVTCHLCWSCFRAFQRGMYECCCFMTPITPRSLKPSLFLAGGW